MSESLNINKDIIPANVKNVSEIEFSSYNIADLRKFLQFILTQEEFELAINISEQIYKTALAEYKRDPSSTNAIVPDDVHNLVASQKSKMDILRAQWRIMQTVHKQNEYMYEFEAINIQIDIAKAEIIELSAFLQKRFTNMESEGISEVVEHTKQIFSKIKADLIRQECEIQLEDDEIKNTCEEQYKVAIDLCSNLDMLDDTRLGLTLNQAVFINDIRNDRDKAILSLETEYKKIVEAMINVDMNTIDDRRIHTIQGIKDNIIIWNEEKNM